jgi:hypothetical protein
MSPDRRPLETVLEPLNPLPLATSTPPLDDRARVDLTAILASSPEPNAPPWLPAGPRQRPSLLLVLPVAGLLALVLVVGLTIHGPGGGSAYAATPQPLTYHRLSGETDATDQLIQIAKRTAALPDDVGGGPYAHQVIRSWSLFTRIDGKAVSSEVVPQLRETWTAANGSGKEITTIERPGRAPQRQEHTEVAGELRLMWPLQSLSSKEAELAEQLAKGHPTANGPAERLIAIQDAYRSMPIPPAVRARMLRYLADTPGLSVAGSVTDRAGRAGLAVGLDSAYSGLPTRYVLIIDPQTGQLLADEETLTTSAGKLNVRIPSVVSYEVFLSAHYTGRIG